MADPLPEWVAPYVRGIADQVGLKDWTILCERGDREEGIVASTEVIYGRRLAYIRFRPPFFETENPQEQRNTVAHELLHCHVDPVRAAFDDGVRDSEMLTPAVYNATWNGMRRAAEMAVDGIASAIDKFFPLPPATACSPAVRSAGDASGSPGAEVTDAPAE